MRWKAAAAFSLAAMSTSLAICGQALAWGQEGHAVIAEIAQHRLSRNAYDVIEQLLRSHLKLKPPATVSLASVASWADDYRADNHKETSNWHFIDIPLASKPGDASASATAYDPARDCKDNTSFGFCLMRALPAQEKILADPAKSDEERWQALAFVIHLVGDLSQPLHCVERLDGSQGDQGGNTLTVSFNVYRPKPDGSTYRDLTTFHAVWDSSLILFKYYDWGKVALDLETDVIPHLPAMPVADQTPEKWLTECHEKAEDAYRALPKGTTIKSDNPHAVILDQAYFDQFSPVAVEQLALGGLHLAAVLDETLAADK
ncbi:S1/P1 nuclease [Mesorhizobium sp. RIZ17]|uniref:S1/P1 nuclease n=1 Tax=Mesorhizobium sp. RIZ17 TaxID=3132743 RepID=UPI003DA9BCA0